jgi:zinc D-Ala-D-Ala dipeptidase
MPLVMVVLGAASLSCAAAEPPAATPDFTWLAHSPDFVDVSAFPHVHTDLRYASDNNFLKKNVYGNFHECYLQRVAAAKFRKAVALLAREHRGWRFVVFDCLRPRSIQKKFYAFVEGTPQQPYVANPRFGSIHNYGFAIDLSLEDEHGNALDMGTGFDAFTPLAEPRREAQYLAGGQLTEQQVANRRILRSIMQRAGFTQLPNEWWHYDALPKREVRAHYRIVE